MDLSNILENIRAFDQIGLGTLVSLGALVVSGVTAIIAYRISDKIYIHNRPYLTSFIYGDFDAKDTLSVKITNAGNSPLIFESCSYVDNDGMIYSPVEFETKIRDLIVQNAGGIVHPNVAQINKGHAIAAGQSENVITIKVSRDSRAAYDYALSNLDSILGLKIIYCDALGNKMPEHDTLKV